MNDIASIPMVESAAETAPESVTPANAGIQLTSKSGHVTTPESDSDDLARLLNSSGGAMQAATPSGSVIVGTLLAFLENRTPLIVYPGQPGTAALAARSTLALTANDIGGEVVLQFERGDPTRPIILGRLRAPEAWPLDEQPAQVQVDADGRRLTVDAKEEITLRCGKASITLTKAGKVLIQGTYVLSRSSGVMRIKGGSVQLN